MVSSLALDSETAQSEVLTQWIAQQIAAICRVQMKKLCQSEFRTRQKS